QVLERTACLVTFPDRSSNLRDGTLELRFTVGLPAAGRTILGHKAVEILTGKLPELVRQSMLWRSMDQQKLMAHIHSVEDQDCLRDSLEQHGLVAFIANGAVLPRQSGVSQLPMTGAGVVPFEAPKSVEVTLATPNRGAVTGMGIPKGITLLSGGGFHGKSTLLEALELGIYNHPPGDGRELVVALAGTTKIRAEDGRSVVGTDISPFIADLPGG